MCVSPRHLPSDISVNFQNLSYCGTQETLTKVVRFWEIRYTLSRYSGTEQVDLQYTEYTEYGGGGFPD